MGQTCSCNARPDVYEKPDTFVKTPPSAPTPEEGDSDRERQADVDSLVLSNLVNEAVASIIYLRRRREGAKAAAVHAAGQQSYSNRPRNEPTLHHVPELHRVNSVAADQRAPRRLPRSELWHTSSSSSSRAIWWRRLCACRQRQRRWR